MSALLQQTFFQTKNYENLCVLGDIDFARLLGMLCEPKSWIFAPVFFPEHFSNGFLESQKMVETIVQRRSLASFWVGLAECAACWGEKRKGSEAS